MTQPVGKAIGGHIVGDVVGRCFGFRAGIAHGHTDARVTQHLHIVAAVAESDGLFPPQAQGLEHMGQTLGFAAACRQYVHKIVVPAHRHTARATGQKILLFFRRQKSTEL